MDAILRNAALKRAFIKEIGDDPLDIGLRQCLYRAFFKMIVVPVGNNHKVKISKQIGTLFRSFGELSGISESQIHSPAVAVCVKEI